MPDTSSRLARVRQAMKSRGLDAVLFPTGDAHLSEYIAERWQTRAYISGFRGSAGTLVVTQDMACLWVDPRYHMRADSETAGTPITVLKQGNPGVPEVMEWLPEALSAGATLGFDPEAVSAQTLFDLTRALGPHAVAVEATPGLVDEVWPDRPSTAPAGVVEHPLEFAGESTTSKVQRLRRTLSSKEAAAMLITGLDEVAWLLNLRGADVPLNPVALAFCVVDLDSVRLFVHLDQVSGGLRAALPPQVELLPYDAVADHLRKMPSETPMLLDPARTNVVLYEAAAHMPLVLAPSPVELMKAVKNSAELAGAAKAHEQDAVAITKLLHWLSVVDASTQTELSVALKLDELRHNLPGYRGRSFDTIVGFGPNSSVGHYKLDAINPQPLAQGGLLLIDCGAQFDYGTTDTTRTVTLGQPTPEQRLTYTTVLRALIMLSSTKFPQGTTGQRLDALGRYHIWNQLWECRHGIGHGVGSYLHVHEGPQRVNKVNNVPFEPGMMNSNEPGVYFEGDFGVRLENVIVTTDAGRSVFGQFYQFTTVTPIPFDRNLIDDTLLGPGEKEWLNSYNRWVYEAVSPHLNDEETAWLREQTAPF